jgi:glycosyltransferase involved in cell wall biosynthesis
MKLGIFVEEDKWTFFNEIFEDLKTYYQTEIFTRKVYKTPLLYGRLNRWAYRAGIDSMLRRNDIGFFEWAGEYLVYASHMPKRSAIITRLHSFELFEWAPKINWDAVDKIILVSHAMRKSFGEYYPDHLHKTEVVYNGVSLNEFKPAERNEFNFDLGMLCSIKPVKRVYEIVLLVHELFEKGYNARLHIAGAPEGDFRYAAAIYQLVDRLGLKEAVKFYGHVNDTADWLRRIDIFISNSFWEGHQVALIEAMASGCYCLSHCWAGSEEALPAENLFVTSRELLDKIVGFANLHDVERQRKQSSMRAITCEKFDIEQTKAKIRNVIEQI